VIGSFLRTYNDRIDDGRRQDLFAYAAKVVGSRASQDVQHARAERLSAWAFEATGSGGYSAWSRRDSEHGSQPRLAVLLGATRFARSRRSTTTRTGKCWR
jgi:hypothetical protein